MSPAGRPKEDRADRRARRDRWRDFENGVLRLNLVCNGFDAMTAGEASNAAIAADTPQLLTFLRNDLPKVLRQQRASIRSSLRHCSSGEEADASAMSLTLLKEDQDRLLHLAADLAEILTLCQRANTAVAPGDLRRTVSRFVAAQRHYLANSTKLAKKCMI